MNGQRQSVTAPKHPLLCVLREHLQASQGTKVRRRGRPLRRVHGCISMASRPHRAGIRSRHVGKRITTSKAFRANSSHPARKAWLPRAGAPVSVLLPVGADQRAAGSLLKENSRPTRRRSWITCLRTSAAAERTAIVRAIEGPPEGHVNDKTTTHRLFRTPLNRPLPYAAIAATFLQVASMVSTPHADSQLGRRRLTSGIVGSFPGLVAMPMPRCAEGGNRHQFWVDASEPTATVYLMFAATEDGHGSLTFDSAHLSRRNGCRWSRVKLVAAPPNDKITPILVRERNGTRR